MTRYTLPPKSRAADERLLAWLRLADKGWSWQAIARAWRSKAATVRRAVLAVRA
jgi:hypothetical protein